MPEPSTAAQAPKAEIDDEETPHYHGHRQRLRERYRKGGGEALPDYELIELLLFAAIPRRDVKPLAKQLLDRFGGFAQLIAADRETLRKDGGLGDAAIDILHIVRDAAVRLTREQVIAKPVLGSFRKVLDYCRATLAHAKTEQFHLLFLDRKNVLIADEAQQRGTVDHTPVYPREVVRRALELGASSIIMVHNHPSGDPTPSRADIDMTEAVIKAAAALGISVHDHIVIGKSGHTSLKSAGLM